MRRGAWGRVFAKRIRQRPTLPRGFPRSTIGSGGLNFRVRDGNGCDPSDIATGKLEDRTRLSKDVSAVRRVEFEFLSEKQKCRRCCKGRVSRWGPSLFAEGSFDLGLESLTPPVKRGSVQEIGIK